MDNSEKSARVIVAILNHLLEVGLQDNHPHKASLDLPVGLSHFFPSCFKWLKAEGIVRAERTVESLKGDISAVNPQLTSRGYAILGKELTIDNKNTTVAEEVKKAAADGASASAIGDFFGGALGGFIKSMGS